MSAVGAASRDLALERSTGERRLGPDGQPLTLGGQGRSVWAVGFAADGRSIAWGNTWRRNDPVLGYGPLQHTMALPSADATPSQPRNLDGYEGRAFRGGEASRGAWSLQYRKGGAYGYDAILDIARDGKIVASVERGPTDGYQHRSYSFTPDGETIISGGSNGLLTAYDREGKKLGDLVGHESEVWAVAPSPDGRYLLSGSAVQTLRLWNLKTRELLITLFYGKGGEWVMWTPQGYFDASGPGGEMIGWQINHGADKDAEYINAAQLRKSLNRPDIVAKAIQLASAEQAVKEAYGTNFKLADLLARPVPRFRIASPAANASFNGGKVNVELAIEATPDPVKLIRIQVNGRQIEERLPSQGGGFPPGKLTLPIPLAKDRNTVRLTAVNDQGETPAEVIVAHEGDGDLDRRGTLYILAIGVDKYPNLGKACRDLDGKTPKSCDLQMAGADARAFEGAMRSQIGPQHTDVVARVLVNGASPADVPTAANILDALSVLRDAKPEDTVAVFISGHGMNEGPNYVFVPTDAAWSGKALRNSSIVPWYAFQLAIEAAKGRRILFLDTCHSGNSYNQRLSNDSYQANIIVYSAARWDQEALERTDLGHGLFTYSLIEGMSGGARTASDEVRAESLRDFLVRRVGELARQMSREQEPQYFRGRDAENYVLVRGQ